MELHGNEIRDNGIVVLSKGENLSLDKWKFIATIIEHADEIWDTIKLVGSDGHIVKVMENLDRLKWVEIKIEAVLDRRKRGVFHEK